MIKKEIIIPILSVLLVIGTFIGAYALETQEIADDKNSIEISNLKTSFAKDEWVDVFDGNITGILKSNKSFDSVSGVIEYYDNNGALINTMYMSQPIKIIEGQVYKINENYYSNIGGAKPASIKIIIYNNDFSKGYQTNESIIYEKKINV